MKNIKYCLIKNRTLATTIAYLLGRKLFVMDDYNSGDKIYSFIDDEEFREVYTLVSRTRNKYNQWHK